MVDCIRVNRVNVTGFIEISGAAAKRWFLDVQTPSTIEVGPIPSGDEILVLIQNNAIGTVWALGAGISFVSGSAPVIPEGFSVFRLVGADDNQVTIYGDGGSGGGGGSADNRSLAGVNEVKDSDTLSVDRLNILLDTGILAPSRPTFYLPPPSTVAFKTILVKRKRETAWGANIQCVDGSTFNDGESSVWELFTDELIEFYSDGGSYWAARSLAQLTSTGLIHPPDQIASEQSPGLYMRGSRPSDGELANYCYQNIICEYGIASPSTSGESGGTNFFYGDERLANGVVSALMPEEKYIGAELTFVGQMPTWDGANWVNGYDTLDPSDPSLVGAIQRTPRIFRIQTARNPITNRGISLFLQSGDSINLQSAGNYQQHSFLQPLSQFRLSSVISASTIVAGLRQVDGMGAHEFRAHGRCSPVPGATNVLCRVSAPEGWISGQEARVKVRLISHELSATREHFEFYFFWLVGTGFLRGPVEMAPAAGIAANLFTSIAGRISAFAEPTPGTAQFQFLTGATAGGTGYFTVTAFYEGVTEIVV